LEVSQARLVWQEPQFMLGGAQINVECMQAGAKLRCSVNREQIECTLEGEHLERVPLDACISPIANKKSFVGKGKNFFKKWGIKSHMICHLIAICTINRESVYQAIGVRVFVAELILAGIYSFEGSRWRHENKDTFFVENLYVVQVFTLCVGFMVVFRFSMAFSRCMDAKKLTDALLFRLHVVAAQAMASDDDPAWKRRIAGLISLLAATMLQSLSPTARLEILPLLELDERHLKLLDSAKSFRSEICSSWVLDALLKEARSGTPTSIKSVPPPITSRLFQELAAANGALTECQTINNFKFPFVFQQMVAIVLLLFNVGAPLVVYKYVQDACVQAFMIPVILMPYFGLNEAAERLEEPFDKVFGIDVQGLSDDFNTMLLFLCEPFASKAPAAGERAALDAPKARLDHAISETLQLKHEGTEDCRDISSDDSTREQDLEMGRQDSSNDNRGCGGHNSKSGLDEDSSEDTRKRTLV
jgi:predicted membrane chloride channel (bestrophin family)